jgi:hypothetical protein
MTGIDDLTDEELRSFNAAIEALRAHLPGRGFIHTGIVRNLSGTLSEVRAYGHDGGRVLAEVAIRADGALAPVRVR